jgi:aryl-alcohol dehydrogenase-like predicted oxidoreductase
MTAGLAAFAWPGRAAGPPPNSTVDIAETAGAMPLAHAALYGPAADERRGEMLYRPLGTTGVRVSVIGLGGAHFGEVESEAAAIRLARSAIDRGVTFMDNCWSYGWGRAEQWMGAALRDGYRERVFLMTKIDGRTKQAAATQIEESLQRLGVEHVDLLQFHEVIRMEDPDRIFADDGAAAAVRAAQRAGQVRFIGFTGHKDPLVHRRMLALAAENDCALHTVQMPLNVMDAHFRSFEHQVLPILQQRGIGVIGMKTFGGDGNIPKASGASFRECLQYALSLPTSTHVLGIRQPEWLEEALAVVRDFRPLSSAERTALLARTRETALTGKCERFKTSARYDLTAKHPDVLG